MNFDWLKRYMPRGLYQRAALILVLPIVTLQIVVSVVFIQRHFEDVARQMTRALTLDLALLLQEVGAAPEPESARARLARLAGPLQMGLSLPATPVERHFSRRFYDLSGRVLILTLQERVPELRAVDMVSRPGRVLIWLDTPHGVLGIDISRDRVTASNPHQFLVLMLFVGALMTLVAFLYLRNQLRPIKRLARAAEAFGKGRVVEYRPSGAIEVRAAGSAFLDMRARIERQIEQRTAMLSGISHDLRTPLTRLKLGLSMLDETPEREELERDIAEMERLIDAFLDFARADALDERRETDLTALLRDCARRAARGGGEITLGRLDLPERVSLRPMAVARAVGNLVENALRYGSRAHVSAVSGARSVTISIEDDGPGIPPGRREEALQPFSRLDSARNQNRGSGVGLGLAIAADIARRHGGSLRLGESAALGGLRADLVLPL